MSETETPVSLYSNSMEGAVGHMLAIEEHLIGENDLNENMNQWCTKKHALLAIHGHMNELAQISEKTNPELSKKVAVFKKKFHDEISRGTTSSRVRDMRNEFRDIIGDPTLQCKNKLCALDRSDDSPLPESHQLPESTERTRKFSLAKLRGKSIPKPQPTSTEPKNEHPVKRAAIGAAGIGGGIVIGAFLKSKLMPNALGLIAKRGT